MEIKEIDINKIIPYENNPRNNDDAVDKVAESIKQFGFQQPIVVDKDMVVIVGHTRLKASHKLDLEVVPVVIADELSEEQVKAYRLADNKTGEFATWDEEMLLQELNDIMDIDMEDFGFLDDTEEEIEETDNPYTMKVNIPQYEPTGEDVKIFELCDDTKSKELELEILDADITEEEKAFLIQASKRHNVFNYRKIAEYYAQASKEMQELMEKSALVIIDVDNAIANGYASLHQEIEEIYENEK